MRLNFAANPALAERYVVINSETGEEIEGVAWADDEAGLYATFRTRPRTLNDPKDSDLRIRTSEGRYSLTEHKVPIRFEDLTVNPLKGELLALLDDPEVIAKLRRLLGT